jgi:2-polyprenyl-6-methoxyphenol hydroxylase-like FAD-dependent oxidoreductase
MEPDKKVDILVVGAGPTGLMMASQLATHNIRFRIIDKNESPTHHSGAMIMQARSLEIFEQLGIAQKVIQNGTIANEITFIFNGKHIACFNIKNLGLGFTKYPYLLLVEQPKVEKAFADLIKNHGFEIERNIELVSLTEDNDGVVATLKHSEGIEEIIKTKYVIGADGSHSEVRKQLNIPFRGITYPQSFFITDCSTNFNMPHDVISFSISKEAIAGLFPLADGKWRIDGAFTGKAYKKNVLDFNDVGEEFAERTQMKIRLSDPQWFSLFHSSSRIAASFQHNRCFLIGDAAHVQSPIGAQGMNSGMQDAVNLAWKLALVIKNRAKTILLDSYSSERIPVAKNLLRFTDKVFGMVINQDYMTRNFRMHFLPILLIVVNPLIRNLKIRRILFKMISEIGIRYNNSFLTHNTIRGYFQNEPKPGQRFPFFVFKEDGKEVNIQEKLAGNSFHLFIFNKYKFPYDIIRVAEKYGDVLSFEFIHFAKETRKLYRKFRMRESGYILIRPDMHIAFTSYSANSKHLDNYFKKFLKYEMN